MAQYILRDGTAVTPDQIKTAMQKDMAVIVYGRAENYTSESLMLDGKHYDTRNRCVSVWNEVWTAKPRNGKQALLAAYVKD